MSGGGIMSFLSVNRSFTNLGDETRHFRLPTTQQFPKLDKRIAGPASVARATNVVIGGVTGGLPQMSSDLAELTAGYAVENVKRDRGEARPWSRMGWLVGRILGGQRAARPAR